MAGGRSLSAVLTGPVLALDLGGTNARAAVVLPDGRVVSRQAGPTPIADGRDAVVGFVEDLLRSARDEHHGPRWSGPGPPSASLRRGPLDAQRGILIEPPNLRGDWWGYKLGPALGDSLGLPWALERDTVGSILGEWHYGAGRGSTDIVYLTISTGVGGAVVTDGRLLLGPDGVAGELGHMTVAMDGPICGCGGSGHVEAIASGAGIARAARAALEDGTAGAALRAMADGSGVERISAKDVSRAADLGRCRGRRHTEGRPSSRRARGRLAGQRLRTGRGHPPVEGLRWLGASAWWLRRETPSPNPRSGSRRHVRALSWPRWVTTAG